MFKVGDYVVYRRDLCIIKDIKDDKYYKLSMINDDSLIISVPITNDLGLLREPIKENIAKELINKIKSIKPLNINEKLLENSYKELMRTNNHEDLIKIIKTTYLRNKERKDNGKKTSDKDETYFQIAEKCLYNELSIALNMNYDECKNYIIEILNQSEGDTND